MLKTLTAYTTEVDDEQIAIDEIKEQLDLERNLRANSVGIIACHYEFVLSGVAKALCEALPFDVVGTISAAQSVPGNTDIMNLTLMVLTSDETEFSTALTESLTDGAAEQSVTDGYKKAANGKSEKPALIFAFGAFIPGNFGDQYEDALSKVSGDVPVFGTLAVDDTPDFSHSYMLYNGEEYRDKFAVILVYGDIKPKFFYANVDLDKILGSSGVVTKSAGSVLMEVNDRPVIEYFESLGLVNATEHQYAMSSLPFLVDYKDGTPLVSKLFIMLTPEKYAVCGGVVPEGSSITLATENADDILSTTGVSLDELDSALANASGVLVYACISRLLTLGAKPFLEMNLVEGKIKERVPFLTVYSGGEFCPTQVVESKAANRFHNNAFIACVF
ncbi:hypothetical protein FACS1894111_10840 [Clostridia bacterium]|nr:hypothetical protein FACS1894111_10840 [Clostridia bacterium]